MTEMPNNPFIDPNDAENTSFQIDGVLAMLREYAFRTTLDDSDPPATNPAFGVVYVLDGIRDAVRYIAALDTVPGNVTKLEGK